MDAKGYSKTVRQGRVMSFVLGFVAGGFIGIFIMSALTMARGEDENV